jgi:hypothetical protein
MSVVPYDRPSAAFAPPIRSWIGLLEYAAELAAMVADTDFVPKALRGNRAAITAAILYGDEVGLGPMQSLSKVRIIDGTPTLAAETQRALILARGHRLWFPEIGTTRVIASGQRVGEDTVTSVTWTLDDAKRAGVSGRNTYRSYPRQMLTARASAELARAIFADAIGGLRATEEVDEDGAGEPPADAATGPDSAESPPAPRERRRRRSPSLAPVADAPPAPEPPPPALPGEAEGDDGATQDTELLTGAQSRKLLALFRERGMTDRGQRLLWASLTLARKVESSKELTVDEASRLIDVLGAMTPTAGTAGVAPAPETEPGPSLPAPSGEPPELDSDDDAGGAPVPRTDPPKGGAPGDFIDSLEFIDPEPEPADADPRVAAVRAALAGLGAPDRNDLAGLMLDLHYIRKIDDDVAPVVAAQWPALEPSPRALVVLRDQLADIQRALGSD